MDSRKAEKDSLVMPKDCASEYAPSTPEKARMLRIIEYSVKYTLMRRSEEERLLAIKGGYEWKKLPPAVTAVIADFNVDDNFTYVLIEPQGIIFKVDLHDDDDYWSDLPERVGRFGMGEAFYEDKALKARVREKILSHKLERKVIFFP